jgi:glycosyltransferase involved in cell wall biosynthesis
VIYNGFDASQVTEAGAAAEASGLAQRQPYLLFVGTLECRKNLVGLVQAFSRLKVKRKIPHRLVLAGQKGWGWKEIQRAIPTHPFAQEVDVPGYLPREEVLRLYRGADVFIYPSLYEGFGFPVLEAMAAGVPVACSRAASLPEVAGEAAEFFDPYSIEEMTAALERVLESPERQAELRRKGAERVRHFSWEECARRHCHVYREYAGT